MRRLGTLMPSKTARVRTRIRIPLRIFWLGTRAAGVWREALACNAPSFRMGIASMKCRNRVNQWNTLQQIDSMGSWVAESAYKNPRGIRIEQKNAARGTVACLPFFAGIGFRLQKAWC